MKAIIMAAGQSTRTYPLTLTRPKPLLKVCNRTILARQLDALRGIVSGVLLVVGYRKDMIRDAFGDDYGGLRLEYVDQTEQLGTGHAILQCADCVKGPFLALNGDDLFDPIDLAKLAGATNAALAKEVDEPRLYGVFETRDDGTVTRLIEKPENPATNLANVGAYSLTPGIFQALSRVEKSERGEIELTSAIQMLAQESAFRVIEMEGYWLPIGYPWHLLEANEFLLTRLEHRLEGTVSPRAELRGVVSIGAGSVIQSGVVIDGPVIIGENASIGPNCWLRPGATIGDGCRVGQACEIKNTILMDGAAVPHLSYVGDSIIGEKSNFGAGTITANVRHDNDNVKSMVKGTLVDTGRRKLGAIVADNVHTGINTSIYPGRKLWPGTSTLPGTAVTRDIEE